MRHVDDGPDTARIDARGIVPPSAYTIADGPTAPGVAVLVLGGELDLAAAPELRERIEAVSGTLVLDLSDVTFVDSAALRELLRAQAEAPGRLVLAAVPEPLRRLLELTGTAGLFEQAGDLDAALSRLRG